MKNKFEFFSLIAIILGVILGIFVPDGSSYTAFLGDIFLLLLKVLILPIIVLSLFLAIAKISDLSRLKSLGGKTLLYYLFTSSIAVFTGILLANFFIFDGVESEVISTETKTEVDFVSRIFSDNIFASLADGQILHVVLFVLFFSLAFIYNSKESKDRVIALAEDFNDVIMRMISWVLKFAPIGILALVWSTVSSFDQSMVGSLSSFFIATAIGAIIHSFISLPLIGRLLGKFNPYRYFWKVKQALIIAFATASSAATLPVSTKVVEDNGVDPEVAQFTLPIGATLNMDGSAIYQALLALLFISLSGVDITFADQMLLFIFIVLSSAGTAGVPSGGIVMMTMILNMYNVPNPEYYLGIYIMVDRFWDYIITAINVWGDVIGAKTIDSWLKRSEAI